MKVRDLMQARPLTIAATDSWEAAAQLMLWAGVRQLPVLEGGRLVRLVTEREVLAAREQGAFSRPVAAPSHPPPTALHPEQDVIDVVARLLQENQDAFAVVEAGEVVGLVTLTDVLAKLVRRSLTKTENRPERVRDLMTRDPEVASFDDSLFDALGRMRRLGVRHLPIVDGEHHVVGLLSDRDVRRALGDLLRREEENGLGARLRLQKVSDVARRSPLTIREHASLTDAIQMLVDHRVGALPVVDDDHRLVGILSCLDVLAAGRGPELPAVR